MKQYVFGGSRGLSKYISNVCEIRKLDRCRQHWQLKPKGMVFLVVIAASAVDGGNPAPLIAYPQSFEYWGIGYMMCCKLLSFIQFFVVKKQNMSRPLNCCR